MSVPTVAPGESLMEVMIPASKVGLIIGMCYTLNNDVLVLLEKLFKLLFCFTGKGGETIKNLQV
jgi:hypothetical protein